MSSFSNKMASLSGGLGPVSFRCQEAEKKFFNINKDKRVSIGKSMIHNDSIVFGNLTQLRRPEFFTDTG